MTDKRAGRRLASENYHAVLEMPQGCHYLDITVARDEHGVPREVAFTGRGKIGHGLDQILLDLGIFVSRAIQGRDPNTGEEIL